MEIKQKFDHYKFDVTIFLISYSDTVMMKTKVVSPSDTVSIHHSFNACPSECELDNLSHTIKHLKNE